MKRDRKYSDKVVSRILKETLEERADELVSKLKGNVQEMGGMDDVHPKFGNRRFQDMSPEEIDYLMNQDLDSDDEEVYDEFDEGFDDEFQKHERGGRDYNRKEFKNVPTGKSHHRNLKDDSSTPSRYMYNQMDNALEDLIRRFKDEDEDDNLEFSDEDDLDPIHEGNEMCECGGMMYEGECMECGKSYMDEDIYDVDDLDDSNEFDYVEEDELEEKLYGGQKRLDKNKNGRLDKKDFEMLRGETDESETDESREFAYAARMAKKQGKDTFELDGETFDVKESIQLKESELIDLIESIVKEESKLRMIGGKPKGLVKYQQVHAKDGKENNDYLKSVAKKMKDYLKDGSKGEYTENPDHFPKGNGELEKMAKKAYIPSGAVQDYVDNFTAAALENIDYDEIHPNEDWVTDNIEGSARTGNSQKYANAVETDVNKKRNKIRKDNLLAKMKRKAYNKAPQPAVLDKAGESEGDKIMAKLESIEPKKLEQISEEFNKMKSLISYDRKTQ